MSDDEDEGRLQIDESTSDSEDKPSISAPSPRHALTMPSSSFPSNSSAPEPTEETSGKEDGELDEDDDEEDNESTDSDDKEEPKLEIDEDAEDAIEQPKLPEKEEIAVKIAKQEEPVSSESSPASSSSKQFEEREMKQEEISEEPKPVPEASEPTSSDKRPSKSPAASSKKENGSMKPPQSTEKSHRKRKESTDNFTSDKRKSGLETVASSSAGPSSSNLSTPQRSKRSSSHMASLAIQACFTEEDIVSVQMMPIQRTPDTAPTPKRTKRDVGTNVITTRSTDTTGLVSNESIMETPPGSQMSLEVTVMYRTKNSLAFRVKGCDLIGFIGDGLPPMASSLANNNASSTGNNNNKKKANNLSNNDEGKDGRSSSASSNGRSTRGGSVVKDGKADKQKGKRKKEEVNDDDLDDEIQNIEQNGSKKCELMEVDITQLHDCHYDGCEKRFQKSTELEYHIAKNHKKRVMVYESICTQTDISSLKTLDVGTEIDDDLPPTPQMPVLKKEVPIKGPTGLVYEDLSDDDVDSKPTDLVLKAHSSSSAAATLIGIAQASSSSSGSPSTSLAPRSASLSTPVSAKIGINPSMVAQVNAHNAMAEKNKQQQRNAFVPNSPRPNQPSSSTAPSSSAQPPSLIQARPMAGPHFMPPQFHPALMHHQSQMAALAAMDPQMAFAISQHQQQHHQQQQQQQQQQMSRTPSRQTMSVSDSHKIHELAKSKENEQRQRQQATTPKASVGNSVGPSAGAVTPQRQFIPPQLLQAPPGTPQSVQQQHQHQQQQQQQQQQQIAVAQHQLMQQMQLQMQRGGMIPQISQQDQLMLMMMGMQGMGIPMGAAPGAPGFPGPPQQPPK